MKTAKNEKVQENITVKTAENEKVQENMAYAAEKAEGSTGKQERRWLIRVRNNQGFCGIGAGGVQFANGQATVSSERMAQWFMEHAGYEVTEA